MVRTIPGTVQRAPFRRFERHDVMRNTVIAILICLSCGGCAIALMTFAPQIDGVLESQGKPVEGAEVRVVGSQYRNSTPREIVGSPRTVRTDGDGHFSSTAITEFRFVPVLGDTYCPEYAVEARFAGQRYIYSSCVPYDDRPLSLTCHIPSQAEPYQNDTSEEEFAGALKMKCEEQRLPPGAGNG